MPIASQGQPYRGDKQSGENGRATPEPRSALSDLSQDELEKMMKEHEVLRRCACANEMDDWLTLKRRKVSESKEVLFRTADSGTPTAEYLG